MDRDSVAEPLVVREMVEEDCARITRAFAAQGWDKPVSQYLHYLRESRISRRQVLIAEVEGHFAGYVTILWESDYAPFKLGGTPEIADFNVLIEYRRRGVGTMLLDEAERRIAAVASTAGIGVGLAADYGAAQILYVRRGYVPDGLGVSRCGEMLDHGDAALLDDCLTLHLVKVP